MRAAKPLWFLSDALQWPSAARESAGDKNVLRDLRSYETLRRGEAIHLKPVVTDIETPVFWLFGVLTR